MLIKERKKGERGKKTELEWTLNNEIMMVILNVRIGPLATLRTCGRSKVFAVATKGFGLCYGRFWPCYARHNSRQSSDVINLAHCIFVLSYLLPLFCKRTERAAADFG